MSLLLNSNFTFGLSSFPTRAAFPETNCLDESTSGVSSNDFFTGFAVKVCCTFSTTRNNEVLDDNDDGWYNEDINGDLDGGL